MGSPCPSAQHGHLELMSFFFFPLLIWCFQLSFWGQGARHDLEYRVWSLSPTTEPGTEEQSICAWISVWSWGYGESLFTHTHKKNVRIYKKSGGGGIHIFVCIYSLSTSLREYFIWLMLLHPFKVRKATGNSSRYKVLWSRMWMYCCQIEVLNYTCRMPQWLLRPLQGLRGMFVIWESTSEGQFEWLSYLLEKSHTDSFLKSL